MTSVKTRKHLRGYMQGHNYFVVIGWLIEPSTLSKHLHISTATIEHKMKVNILLPRS